MGLTIGDMCATGVEGDFRLVYLVFNTIMNVTGQNEQVAVFSNAAQHLERRIETASARSVETVSTPR